MQFFIFPLYTNYTISRAGGLNGWITPVIFKSGAACGMEILTPSSQGYCESEIKASWEHIHNAPSLIVAVTIFSC